MIIVGCLSLALFPSHGVWVSRTRNLLFVFLLLQSISALSQAAQTTATLLRGVVVEQVDKGLEAEKAGLRIGDVILAWSRSTLRGNIESPFDLDEVATEQNPRGLVVLEGLRGREKQTWEMGRNAWGIGSRPAFSGDFLLVYQQGRKLAKAGMASKAAVLVRTLTNRIQRSDPIWLLPWLLSQAAIWRVTAKQWKEADETYQEALRLAAKAGPKVTSQLLLAWGDQLRTRSEWTRAEECYGQSIIELRTQTATNLTLAGTLNNLGHVAWHRGLLTKAEEYYRQALDVRETLAPGSLDVARTLNNLGNVAWKQGDLAKAEEYHRKALNMRETLAPGSLDVAGSLGNLSNLELDRGDLARAEEYDRKALAIQEQLAPGSLTVATCLNNLGIAIYYQGDLAKAEEYYLQALAIQEKLAPDIQPRINKRT
jgi:tetratricopeptide (TPR) repeat protein